jgi:hypothetical protein
MVTLLRAVSVVLCLLPLVSKSASAQERTNRPRPAVAIPAATTPPVAEEPTIPDNVLQQMYRRELGDRYNPADAPKLLKAHQLLEDYFAATQATARKPIVAQLEATGLDVGTVGRLARLRMHWPDLEPGVYYTNERHGTYDVRYFLGVPKSYDRTKPWPLVVMLPTADAFVTTPQPNADEVAKIYSGWITEELAKHPDALVLMPLLNLDELWGPSYPGMHSVIQPILHAAGRVNVDPRQVYLLGHAMSAHAVWNLALHFPTYFAAINPMAGSASGDWQRLRLINLRNVLPVVWHDAADDVTKVGFARSLVKGMQSVKMDVDYEETNGVGHAPTPEIVERLYRKMRNRRRELYPAEVWLGSNRPDTVFNRVDWLQVYQPIKTGKERRVLFRRGSGMMRVYDEAWQAQAAVTAPNRIEARTTNVATLRLYLNDTQFDLGKPVTVIVDKKPRFEAMVKPSMGEMLKDQAFLGRGWRCYPAVIDLELAALGPPAATQPTGPTTGPATRRGGTITVGPQRGTVAPGGR